MEVAPEHIEEIQVSEEWANRGTAGNTWHLVTASVEDELMRAIGVAMHEHRVAVKKWNAQYGHLQTGGSSSSSSAAAAAAAAGVPQAPKFPPASVKKLLEEGRLHLEAAKKADNDLTLDECARVSSNSMPIARRSAGMLFLFADFSTFLVVCYLFGRLRRKSRTSIKPRAPSLSPRWRTLCTRPISRRRTTTRAPPPQCSPPSLARTCRRPCRRICPSTRPTTPRTSTSRRSSNARPSAMTRRWTRAIWRRPSSCSTQPDGPRAMLL